MKPVFLFFFLLVSGFILGQAKYQYRIPETIGDGWKTNQFFQNTEVDTSNVYKMFAALTTDKFEVESVLLVLNNELILEEYFKENNINTEHDLRSATKSFFSLLMGIAIDKGFIESVNDPISKYLKKTQPEKNLDKRKNDISIKHLLTMSPGWDCNDWDKSSKGQEDKVYRKKEWIQYTLDLPIINTPGEVSNYCSMGTIITAEIIAEAAKMPIDLFAKKHLFEPLGIKELHWGHTSKKEVIPSGKRLYMRSRDMAKIGQLLLNKGRWKDTQIVSEKWLEESTGHHTKLSNFNYGYLWWHIPMGTPQRRLETTMAMGNGGQCIMVFEELNLVAIFTGKAYNSEKDKVPFAIMNDVLLPYLLNSNQQN